MEVSSLNFIKVSLCLSHELTECKRFSGGTRVLSERGSILNVVDVTVFASRALMLRRYSVDYTESVRLCQPIHDFITVVKLGWL